MNSHVAARPPAVPAGPIERPIDWDALIEADRVHGSLYTDPAIYALELERIWRRTWVYVGHESEVPKPFDYVMKSVGPEPVLMIRGRDGKVGLLHNRCPHRGNHVCVSERGTARSFTCPYHGWTFNADGSMRGMPFPSGYEGVDREGLGLGRVARVEAYRGFVFASMAAEGPSLDEHLGAAKGIIDEVCRNSPTGEVELTCGFLKHKVKANWKFVVENETDGYHPGFVHSSIFQVSGSRITELYGDKSLSLARYLGNGHTEIDLRPEFRKRAEPLSWFGTTPARLPDYVARMNEAYGEDKAREIMIDGVPHVMIYPNLFIAEIQLFSIQPLAVDQTVQHVTALQFKGAPDINRRLRQQTMGSVGPAGFLLADDAVMYEGTQIGVGLSNPEWLYIGRGRHRERQDEQGYLVGCATDETTTRGIWRHYRSLMEAA
ncbi:aromatic ring-hydroxylating oxygenase subunit alpha [Zavarzinia compransoris]|uniref:Ring-hydroxylating oxygenase subunit alpha n=1 Tax=Zavarzinia compransoris TaxID=1264899 RepID=A0A317E4T2_9PROT|nr:aromatic ring-hydroxylating dioxygenase subunit alpha [Zavarzinia compransoris]PWR21999.1 ring-hydroxylating oxygenase subunit alpha [Zavarzinia compransoris]TDP47262.1 phenylpropionate dioxygenase-like ring-hydroxylating dioxygenase large terminal subunit [Zavarzinia compransoris]